MLDLLGTITLPDAGVDAADYVSVVLTGLGTVAAAAIAAGFSFWLVKKGVAQVKRWIN